jgi:hypothetical protein
MELVQAEIGHGSRRRSDILAKLRIDEYHRGGGA